MSADTTITPSGSAVSPTDNPIEWFEQRVAKLQDAPVAEAQPAATAAPAAPEPVAEPSEPWYEEGLADAKHGFLRGRKGPEVENAFRHSERAKQQAERERNELRIQLEQSRAEVAARNAALQAEITRRGLQQQPGAAPAPEDQFVELENLFFTDRAEYARRLVALQESKAEEKTKQLIEADRAERRQASEAEAFETRKRELTKQSETAWQSAGTNLGLAPDVWEKRSMAVLVALTDPTQPYFANGGPLNEANYLAAYREIFGEPAAPVVAPVAQTPATPPGSRKPATTTGPTNGGLPTLSEARRQAVDSLASIGGLDPEKLAARVARRHGGRNA